MYLFINNLIGLAIGPTAVALVTDFVFENDAAVGASLSIVGAGAGAGACLLSYLSLKPFRKMLAADTF